MALSEKQKGLVDVMTQRFAELHGCHKGLDFLEKKLGSVHALACSYRMDVLKPVREAFEQAQKAVSDSGAVDELFKLLEQPIMHNSKIRKESPILFSTPMVVALLAGRKTMTRRIVKPQPIDNREVDGNFFQGNHKGYVKVDGHPNWQKQFAHEFVRWKVGDILWVRETFQILDYPQPHLDTEYRFKADEPRPEWQYTQWKPAIHMPKQAARIWLEVTEAWVEPLHDITEEDAKAEGVWKRDNHGFDVYPDSEDKYTDAMGFNFKTGFQNIWEKINGKESWNANLWVCVIKFNVLSTTGKRAWY
jgi:hypothetical protein